jgi:hypothetical protein
MPKQTDSVQKKDRSVRNDNILFFLKKTTNPKITKWDYMHSSIFLLDHWDSFLCWPPPTPPHRRRHRRAASSRTPSISLSQLVLAPLKRAAMQDYYMAIYMVVEDPTKTCISCVHILTCIWGDLCLLGDIKLTRSSMPASWEPLHARKCRHKKISGHHILCPGNISCKKNDQDKPHLGIIFTGILRKNIFMCCCHPSFVKEGILLPFHIIKNSNKISFLYKIFCLNFLTSTLITHLIIFLCEKHLFFVVYYFIDDFFQNNLNLTMFAQFFNNTSYVSNLELKIKRL